MKTCTCVTYQSLCLSLIRWNVINKGETLTGLQMTGLCICETKIKFISLSCYCYEDPKWGSKACKTFLSISLNIVCIPIYMNSRHPGDFKLTFSRLLLWNQKRWLQSMELSTRHHIWWWVIYIWCFLYSQTFASSLQGVYILMELAIWQKHLNANFLHIWTIFLYIIFFFFELARSKISLLKHKILSYRL